ncbi:tetratricopeptide repeat protein [Ruminococcus sp. 5_1_39BFAA]|uniref:tetratricopeptide repeat protein n=1 Tax=Ruminococcus sp. 5_1_39BFAA TaxID=457412 RepID=UPI003569511E
MNCMNCGAFLTDKDLDYCPHCGCNVLIQKKVDYLSKFYYNQGLEKASIRDLSGAINCLKQSLTYDKRNIQARNLLGLVYFETGEVVAALSEWVISKNLKPTKNLANEYISRLQANSNKLDAINETIRKYNNALALCREGHEDMAAIQLRKILTQNSKLIKGYHLLALIQMKNHEWSKARRTLRKAARIDKTNTTTLRFLREVDEQTGVTTRLEKQKKGLFHGKNSDSSGDEGVGSMVVHAPAYRENSRISLFVTLMLGVGAGVLGFWLLAVPAIRQGIYREANQQIVRYSESLASQGAELSKAQGEARESGDTAEEIAQQLEAEKKNSQSYQSLLKAYYAYRQDDYDSAALEIQNVYEDVLSDDVKGIYDVICEQTGVSGISDNPDQDNSGSDDSSGDDYGNDDSNYDDSYNDDSDYDSDGYYDEDGNYIEY